MAENQADQPAPNTRVQQWNRMLEMLHRSRQGDEYSYSRARNLYAQKYPEKYVPSRQSFRRVLSRYKEYGRVDPPRKRRPRPVCDGPLREIINQRLAKEPIPSMRELAKQLNASRETVRKIAKETFLTIKSQNEQITREPDHHIEKIYNLRKK